MLPLLAALTLFASEAPPWVPSSPSVPSWASVRLEATLGAGGGAAAGPAVSTVLPYWIIAASTNVALAFAMGWLEGRWSNHGDPVLDEDVVWVTSVTVWLVAALGADYLLAKIMSLPASNLSIFAGGAIFALVGAAAGFVGGLMIGSVMSCGGSWISFCGPIIWGLLGAVIGVPLGIPGGAALDVLGDHAGNGPLFEPKDPLDHDDEPFAALAPNLPVLSLSF